MRRMHDQHSRRMSQNTHLAVPANGRRPLLVSTSLPLIDRVVRLASTAALEVQVAPDAASATRYWLDAPLVMIGSDVSMGHDLPGKRARVIVVHVQEEACGDADTRDVETRRQRDMWRFAVEVGAEHVVELPEGERWLIESFRACAVSAWSMARSEAAMIADLAALAAARSSACSAAEEVARLHHSTLAECAFDGTDVEVAVTFSTASAWTPAVTRRARSGY